MPLGPLKHADTLDEDTVTRLVFEPLAYMDPGEAGRALLLAFPEALLAGENGSTAAFQEVRLQPPLKLWFREEPISVPDVMADLICDELRVRLIIEVKWNGSSLRPRQALLQWEKHRGSTECRHVFLVDERQSNQLRLEQDIEVAKADSRLSGWRERCSVRLWRELAYQGKKHGRINGGPAERWLFSLAEKLRKWGQQPFGGFRGASQGTPSLNGDVAFYSDSRALFWPAEEARFAAPLFWKN